MGTIEIKNWTMKNPLECIGYFAGVCWGAPVGEPEKDIKRAINCIKSGHGRVEELPDVYVVIDGWSSKCLRELYTHIGGSPTRMQASTRYIDYEQGFKAVVPKKVNSEEAKQVWNETMNSIQDGMTKLKELGVPKEDYTNVLPLAYESKMIWKINLRTLINFFGMRMCSRAYWEIRDFSNMLKQQLEEYSPEWKTISELLFKPKCEQIGYCTEAQCCGRMPKGLEGLKEKIINDYKEGK